MLWNHRVNATPDQLIETMLSRVAPSLRAIAQIEPYTDKKIV